ncbi:MAG: serine hydrolase [Caldilineaceae bacterium]
MTNLLWQRLQRELERKVAAFPGVAGIALRELGAGLSFGINADEVFPTASTIKIHVLTKLLQRAEAGELDLDERIAITPSDHVLGSGVIAYLDGPLTLSLRDLATLMMIASDNTATNLCIERAGIAETNVLLQSLGLRETILRRKMMDNISAMREQENVSTPAELIAMIEFLHNGQPSATVAEQALTIMKKHNYGFIDRGVPATVAVANKPGWIEAVMCDAALIYLPRRPYLLAVMTKYALCDAVMQENFIVDISATVYATMKSLDASSRYGRIVYTD